MGGLGAGRLGKRHNYDSPFGPGRALAPANSPSPCSLACEGGVARVISPALAGISDQPPRRFAAVCGKPDACYVGLVASCHPHTDRSRWMVTGAAPGRSVARTGTCETMGLSDPNDRAPGVCGLLV